MKNHFNQYKKKACSIGLALLLAFSPILQNSQSTLQAEEVSKAEINTTTQAQVIVTKYADLWQSKSDDAVENPVYVKAGIPVIWYVDVPEDIKVKGCRSTIKIPGIGWGTDSYNKEEGHLQLTNGRNLIQRPDAAEGDLVLFTPTEETDILFTCWMGSGCHKNYFRVVPNIVVTTATPTAVATESPVVTATVIPTEIPKATELVAVTETPKATEVVASTETPKITEVVASTETPKITEVVASTETPKITELVAATETPKVTEVVAPTETPKVTEVVAATEAPQVIETANTEYTTIPKATDAAQAQVIITKYEDLWQSKSADAVENPIYVTVGVPVIWYVDVPEDVAVRGCKSTIKIPGIGWGTDSYNKEEGHLQLTNGRNLIQRPDAAEGDLVLFTPTEETDILFTCWMGSGCHKNYIRVVAKKNGTEATIAPVETQKPVPVESQTPAGAQISAGAENQTPAGVETQAPVVQASAVPTAQVSQSINATLPLAQSTEETANVPTLQKSAVTLVAGATAKIVVQNANGKAITYQSLNKKVASVSKTGVVTALKKGSTNIQVTVGETVLTYQVKVEQKPALSKNVIAVKKGKTVTVTLKGQATNHSLKYTNSKLVKITKNKTNSKLYVKGLKVGAEKLKITVNGVVLSLKITVKK